MWGPNPPLNTFYFLFILLFYFIPLNTILFLSYLKKLYVFIFIPLYTFTKFCL